MNTSNTAATVTLWNEDTGELLTHTLAAPIERDGGADWRLLTINHVWHDGLILVLNELRPVDSTGGTYEDRRRRDAQRQGWRLWTVTWSGWPDPSNPPTMLGPVVRPRQTTHTPLLPAGTWGYNVDDTTSYGGRDWWPFVDEHNRPMAVRLAPDTELYAWGDQYVRVGPGPGALAHATIHVVTDDRQTWTTFALLDLGAKNATVDPGCPPEIHDEAQKKADKILTSLLNARRERDAGKPLLTAGRQHRDKANAP